MNYPSEVGRVQVSADLLSELLDKLTQEHTRFGEIDTVSIYYNTYVSQWIGVIYGDLNG